MWAWTAPLSSAHAPVKRGGASSAEYPYSALLFFKLFTSYEICIIPSRNKLTRDEDFIKWDTRRM